MGGLAGKIAAKYPEVAKQYKDLCKRVKDTPWVLLGTNQLVWIDESYRKVGVLNMFSQYDYGHTGRHTEYSALRQCISYAGRIAYDNDIDLYIPYQIGCGLGGGDWEVVEQIINTELRITGTHVRAYICKI